MTLNLSVLHYCTQRVTPTFAGALAHTAKIPLPGSCLMNTHIHTAPHPRLLQASRQIQPVAIQSSAPAPPQGPMVLLQTSLSTEARRSTSASTPLLSNTLLSTSQSLNVGVSSALGAIFSTTPSHTTGQYFLPSRLTSELH